MAAKTRLDGENSPKSRRRWQCWSTWSPTGHREQADHYLGRCVKANEAAFGPNRKEFGERLVSLAVTYRQLQTPRRAVQADMTRKGFSC